MSHVSTRIDGRKSVGLSECLYVCLFRASKETHCILHKGEGYAVLVSKNVALKV
jgi:hypothetical protein